MDPIVREMYRLLDLGVDGDTLKQWLVMVRMAEQFNASVIWPSLETLGRMTGTRQEETVRKRARTLELHKAIRIEPVPGRSTRYHLTVLEGGHNHPTGSVSPDPDLPEDLQPKAGDPIHSSESDPSPPAKWQGLRRVLELWDGRWKLIVRKLRAAEGQPTRTTEPVEQSGALAAAADASRQAPPRGEQPKAPTAPSAGLCDPLEVIRSAWEYIGDRTFRHRRAGHTMPVESLEAAEYGLFTFREEDWPAPA